MAQFSRVEPRKYAAARQRVADGIWTIDADRGQIIGPSGHSIGRTTGTRQRRPNGRTSPRYVTIQIVFDGLERDVAAHRVIWEAVNGPIPDGFEINHLNGDKLDNRIANLELVTGSQNVTHALRNGLVPRHVKLTPTTATALRYQSAAGVSTAVLAARYHLTEAAVRQCIRGQTWAGEKAGGPVRPVRRLAWEQVRAMRQEHADGVRPADISRKFDYPRRSLYRVLHNLTWKEPTDVRREHDD